VTIGSVMAALEAKLDATLEANAPFKALVPSTGDYYEGKDMHLPLLAYRSIRATKGDLESMGETAGSRSRLFEITCELYDNTLTKAASQAAIAAMETALSATPTGLTSGTALEPWQFEDVNIQPLDAPPARWMTTITLRIRVYGV
jgi:hypothetical protein